MRARNLAAQKVSSTADWRLLTPELRRDVRRSLTIGINAGTRFACPARPINIFRRAISDAITDKTDRLENVLRNVNLDDLENGVQGDSSEAYMRAVRFAVSRSVSALQGSLAELLAVGPCVQLIEQLRKQRRLPRTARVHVGDAVLAFRGRGRSLAKAADFHILASPSKNHESLLCGVGEVKSYRCSQLRLRPQLQTHLARASRGIAFTRPYEESRTCCSIRLVRKPLQIGVVAASWHLSRHVRFVSSGAHRSVVIWPPRPDAAAPLVGQESGEWRIVLRWSQEALAAAAYDILLWCLGRVGERVYGEIASPWPNMPAHEAGQNAVKLMLYSALRLPVSSRTGAQAIKLYNVLGFGYALGTSFRDRNGRPAVLFPQDLDEILRDGRTAHGSYLIGMPPNPALH